MSKQVIIVGAGISLQNLISQDLWTKIKGKAEIFSLNSIFKIMPYNPTTQLWVDTKFFMHEIDNLQRLHKDGVRLIAKTNAKLLPFKDKIIQYEATREKIKYYGKEAIQKKVLYIGTQGLVGFFALSLAIAEGYNELFLLGYDYGLLVSKKHERKTHVYQDRIKQLNIYSSGAGRPEIYLHPDKKKPNGSIIAGQVKKEVQDFEVYLKETDVKIYNVSPQSNISCFEKIDYQTFFAKLKESK